MRIVITVSETFLINTYLCCSLKSHRMGLIFCVLSFNIAVSCQKALTFVFLGCWSPSTIQVFSNPWWTYKCSHLLNQLTIF